jgi:crotonobetainyl-CoA:carnitine CoA-transferase CaiB-like acyl-CoA transferase
MSKGPLNGIKVVEVGNAVAGPLCTALLGDFGATVIKIEQPGRGDDSRKWGEQVGSVSPYFIYYNRNKLSLTLDLKNDKGRKILKKILYNSDVFVENLRPGAIERLGLSYKNVRKLNPRLIYCSVSGFGQNGPYRDFGGYDAIVQAMCGVMAVTGEKSGPPLRVGFPVTDIAAAMFAALSILSALFYREKEGKGQFVDVSLFESGVSLIGQWLTINMLTGKKIERFGNSYPLLAPYEVFNAKDREIVVAVGNDELWARLCLSIKREDLVNDPRFKTNLERIKEPNRRELYNILQEELKKKDAEEWVRIFTEKGIPCSTIKSIEELKEDPQLRARSVFRKTKHSTLGTIPFVFPLPRMSIASPDLRLPAPALGEHTATILRKLGIKKREIEMLRKARII